MAIGLFAAPALAMVTLPFLLLGRRLRLFVLLGIGSIILALPLLAPADDRIARAVIAMCCGTLVLKLYDLHYGAQCGQRTRILDRVYFLLHPFCLVQRCLSREPQPTLTQNIVRLLRGIVALLIGAFILQSVFNVKFTSPWFVMEHVVKAVLVFVLVYGQSETAIALWRMMTPRGRHMMDNFFKARTPAEFWRLYNRPVGQFFFEDVFMRVNGPRFPFRATMLCFLISGLAHEYIADIAVGRVQGLQFAFFVIQGMAVAATQRCMPTGAAAVASWLLTMLFMIGTSILFFASAHPIVPWYSEAAPAWIRAD